LKTNRPNLQISEGKRKNTGPKAVTESVTMKSKINSYIGVLILVMASIGCSDKAVYDHVQTLPAEGWDFEDTIHFITPLSDTSQSYDILVHLRNTKDYTYQNIWLFLTVIAPTGSYQRDTLEIMLADETGRWLGKGPQSVNTMLAPYLKDVKFPYRGIYTFEIQHAMRDTILYNITDIGFRIQHHPTASK
jgi:gliding motility-associated lipoprotein GldH